jgi:hypothetical protein
LIGTSVGSGDASGLPTATGELGGTSVGESTASAAPSLAIEGSGVANAVGGAIGSLVATGELTGASAGVGDAAGSLTLALVIAATTRDKLGAPLGGCRVFLFLTATDELVASTVSDGSGKYRFDNPGPGPFYVVSYLVGAPDVFGTTVNTLVPS